MPRAPSAAFSIVARYPHDSASFTEGLVLRQDGTFLESSGGYGHSALVQRTKASEGELRRTNLPGREFGEGIALVNGRVYQLTWREGTAHIYDETLRPVGSLHYSGEGWGLAFDGKWLISSDGSSVIRYRDPQTFREAGTVRIFDGNVPVERLNELEYARGLIYANVWKSNRIAEIQPATGHVLRWVDLTALSESFKKPPKWDSEDDVLNGIAYNAETDRFFVTGKCWPDLFELSIPRGTP